MSVQVNNPSKSILATGTIAAFRLVTAAGVACALDTNKDNIGVSQHAAVSGEEVEVRLSRAGTCKVTASEAIPVGAVLYKAAAGKVSDTAASSVRVGVALTPATGDNSIIEALLD